MTLVSTCYILQRVHTLWPQNFPLGIYPQRNNQKLINILKDVNADLFTKGKKKKKSDTIYSNRKKLKIKYIHMLLYMH